MSESKKKLSTEDLQTFAGLVVKPVLECIDRGIFQFTPEDLKVVLSDMSREARISAAFPFPETMQKAEEMKLQNEVFSLIIQIMEARQAQRDFYIKRHQATPGEQIIKQIFGDPTP